MSQAPPNTPPPAAPSVGEAAELLVTLFELGREVTSVLDLDELLEKIPQLISRLTPFKAFAVWLLDEKSEELRIAYAVGYPEDVKRHFRLRLGQGIIGTAVAEGRSLLIDDVHADARYVGQLTGVTSQLAVPLRRKKRVIGALNLYGESAGQFTARDEAMLRQFAAHVAVAIENARLFEREREYSATLETLAEIGREVASILDLDQLLERVATLVHKVIAYRTFGIFLLNERAQILDLKLAIRFGESRRLAAAQGGRRDRRLRRRAQGRRQRPRRDQRHPLHPVGRGLPVRAGDPAARQGSLHWRARSREPQLRRVQQA